MSTVIVVANRFQRDPRTAFQKALPSSHNFQTPTIDKQPSSNALAKPNQTEIIMKFINLILAAALVSGTIAQVSLAQKWNLTEPAFAYESLSFALDFDVTDFVTNGMSDYSLWTSPGCQEEGIAIAKGEAGPWTETRLDDIDAQLASLTGANTDRTIR